MRGAGAGGVLMLAPEVGPRLGVHRAERAARSRATRSRAWRRRTCRRRCTCWARRRTRAAAGRTWGCAELYLTLAGLPFPPRREVARARPRPPARDVDGHAAREGHGGCAASPAEGRPARRRALRFPGARAMGLHIAKLCMVLDPEFVVIGGGLMDPESTTDAFRARYLRTISRHGAPAPVAAAAATRVTNPAVDAGRALAGDRRGARGALSQPGLSRGLRPAPRVRR